MGINCRSKSYHLPPCSVHVHQCYYNLQTAVAAIQQLWCQSDTEAEVPFIPVEGTDNRIYLDSVDRTVRKMMKGHHQLPTMVRHIHCVSAAG